MKINLTVNEKAYEIEVDENTRLVDFLREDLGLAGTKEGCGEGECGACTVIMDGETVNSCLVMAFQADGSEIITIEGVERDGELHPIQRAFVEVGAVQCGYCIPGMVLSSKAMLDKSLDLTREDIREGISGNICRCTGYEKIVDAVEKSIVYMKGEDNES